MNHANFFNLKDAFDYLSKCLVCQRGMGLTSLLGGINSSLEFEYDNSGRGDFHPNIIYTTYEKGYKDKFVIGIHNNDVYRNIENTTGYNYITSGQDDLRQDQTVNYSDPPVSGTKYLALFGKCIDCRKYGFVLQIIIELGYTRIVDIVFNSETVVFQTNTMAEGWELKNIYTTNKTICTYFPPPVPGTIVQKVSQDFPLLPLSRKNPTETLERVKNLLIFT